MRPWVIALAILAAVPVPASADSRFRIAVAAGPGVPPGRGECDIRLEIDREVKITIRRDAVVVATVSGEDARDGGSECNLPLPDREVRNFAVEPVDSRGQMRILERPSARNDYAVVLQVVDAAQGFGRYHFRLSWESPAARTNENPPLPPTTDEQRPDAPEGFVWNNAIEYKGRGSGETVLNDDAGQRLGDVRADIDLGGRIVVAFTPQKQSGVRVIPRPVLFTGSVMTREGSSIRADMVSQDHRLHGTMTLAVDDNHNVNSITLNATDGQDRLRLTWGRR
jgi:hypothetical protein